MCSTPFEYAYANLWGPTRVSMAEDLISSPS